MRLRRQLVLLLPAASWPLTVATLAVVALSAAIPPLLMVSVGHAVNEIPAAVAGGTGSAGARRLLVDLTVVGVLFSLGQAISPLLFPLADQLAVQARSVVFRRIMAAYLRPASIAHLEDPELRGLVDRVQDAGFFGTRQAVRAWIQRWATRLGGAGGIVLLGLYRWWAGILMLVVVTHAVRRMRIAHFEISRIQYSQTKTFRRSDYLRELLLAPGAEKETRMFGLGSWIIGWLRDEWGQAMAPVWERRRHSARDMAWGIAPMVAASTLIVASAVHTALGHAISVGELVVVLQATYSALGAASVSGNDTQVELGMVVIEAVRTMEEGIAARMPQAPGLLPAAGRPEREIRFEDVRFCYPGQSRQVLAGLDLVIPAGRSLAVVGNNGTGKTTLIKLLTRLHDPTGGRISVDGIPLEELDPLAWQRRNAAVFQDFVRYPWSAADNIALREGADRDILEDAARRAGALELIMALPDGWDTILSRGFGGVDLSGGQWQRVALARGLFAASNGAGVLVLDEPTAHLDARQEADFYERFLDVTSGLTTIIVSHRFSTVRRADRIVVVERGRVAESGTHDELIDMQGRYAHMFSLQSARFTDGNDDAG